LKMKPQDAVLLSIMKNGLMETVLIVSFYGQLHLSWYKVEENDIVLFWNMPVQQLVVHINAHRIQNKNVLLVATNSTIVNLYEYNINGKTPQYWMLHSLHLSNPVESSAFSNFEYDYYLSLPQKSKGLLQIYKFEAYRFQPYKNITCNNIRSAVPFEIGFKSFLAVDGFHAGIYRFTKRGLVKEDIANSNLDWITYWLPVPVLTHRDEVVLFAQRTLNHGTHTGYVIEIITNNGGKFEEHEDIPCYYFGEHQSWATCLSHNDGIAGSSYIAVDEKLAVILPDASNKSVLFDVHFTIKEMPNPKEKMLEKIVRRKQELEETILKQNNQYKELKHNLTAQYTIDTPDNESKKNSNSTFVLSKTMQNENLEKEERKEYKSITINGRLKVEGNAKIKKADIDKIQGIHSGELLADIVRKDSLKNISGIKTFTDMELEEVSFDKVNDIKSNELVSKAESLIHLNGDIIFRGPEVVDISKKYNGFLEFDKIKISNQLETENINDLPIDKNMSKSSDSHAEPDFENELDLVTVPLNVSVTNINGINLKDFLRQLCLVNIKCYIPGQLKILGNVLVTNETFAEKLNGLDFPEEYVLTDS
ncbi:hypothetical protein NQ317_003372, partial [Molorchus minor]